MEPTCQVCGRTGESVKLRSFKSPVHLCDDDFFFVLDGRDEEDFSKEDDIPIDHGEEQ